MQKSFHFDYHDVSLSFISFFFQQEIVRLNDIIVFFIFIHINKHCCLTSWIHSSCTSSDRLSYFISFLRTESNNDFDIWIVYFEICSSYSIKISMDNTRLIMSSEYCQLHCYLMPIFTEVIKFKDFLLYLTVQKWIAFEVFINKNYCATLINWPSN